MKELALITGASSGIGKELARVMAGKGHNLILAARSKEAMQALADELVRTYQIEAYVIAQDLSKPAAPEELYNEVRRLGLTVDILVNNAGFGLQCDFYDSDAPSFLSMLQLNIISLTHLTRLFLPDMVKRRRGRIMNVGSTASFAPTATMAVYGATKAYVLSFSDALSEELKGSGVTVTTLCPGATVTGFGKHADVESSFMFRMTAMKAVSVARIGYTAMMKGKRRIVPGWFNKLLALFSTFAPVGFILTAGKKLMSKAH